MEKEKRRKSRIVLEFDNPEANKIIRTYALLSNGMTMKGLFARLIMKWLVNECDVHPSEVQKLLGYKL